MSLVYGLLVSFYVAICLFLALIILVQKSKSSMGLGGLGGGSQMLFGSSGGQDLFQKITWVLGGLFMGLSLLLALMKSREAQSFRYIRAQRAATAQTAPVSAPVKESAPAQKAAPKPEATAPEPVAAPEAPVAETEQKTEANAQ